MKFINLIVPVGICSIGEIVRISKSNTICKIVSKSIFHVSCQLINGSGTFSVDSKRNVHRKIE